MYKIFWKLQISNENICQFTQVANQLIAVVDAFQSI